MDLNGIMPSEGFPGGSDSEESACNAGNLGLILGSRRSHEDRVQTLCTEVEHESEYTVWEEANQNAQSDLPPV